MTRLDEAIDRCLDVAMTRLDEAIDLDGRVAASSSPGRPCARCAGVRG